MIQGRGSTPGGQGVGVILLRVAALETHYANKKRAYTYCIY